MGEPKRQADDFAEFVASLPRDAEFMDFDLPDIEGDSAVDGLARVLADRVVLHLAEQTEGPGRRPRWLKVREAAEEFRVSERLIRDLLARGEIVGAAVRLGGIWRIDPLRLERVLGLEDADGVVAEEEEEEQGHGKDGAVLVDLLEGSGSDPHPGSRLLEQARRRAGSHRVQGQARRKRRYGRADEFRQFLLGDSEDDANPA